MATVIETPTLGEWLKGFRVEAGLSQTELAARTGLTVSRISQIENGRRSLPSPKLIVRWLEACDAPLPWRLPTGRLLPFPDRDLALTG